MEVTKAQFCNEEFKTTLKTADYIAIDTEFSGFSQTQTDRVNEFDTVEERY